MVAVVTVSVFRAGTPWASDLWQAECPASFSCGFLIVVFLARGTNGQRSHAAAKAFSRLLCLDSGFDVSWEYWLRHGRSMRACATVPSQWVVAAGSVGEAPWKQVPFASSLVMLSAAAAVIPAATRELHLPPHFVWLQLRT